MARKTTNAKARTFFVDARVERGPKKNSLRIGLFFETTVGELSDDSDEHWIADLEAFQMTRLAGMWPVPVKVNMIVKMYVKLENGALNSLRRELAIKALREKRQIVV